MLGGHHGHDSVAKDDGQESSIGMPIDGHPVTELRWDHLHACHEHEGSHGGAIKDCLQYIHRGVGVAGLDKGIQEDPQDDAKGGEGGVGQQDGECQRLAEFGLHHRGTKGECLDPLVGKEGNQEGCQFVPLILARHPQALHEGMDTQGNDKDECAGHGLGGSDANAIHLATPRGANINGLGTGYGIQMCLDVAGGGLVLGMLVIAIAAMTDFGIVLVDGGDGGDVPPRLPLLLLVVLYMFMRKEQSIQEQQQQE